MTGRGEVPAGDGPLIRRRRSTYADRLLEFPDFVFSDGAEFQRRGAWHDFFRTRIGSAFDGRVIFEVGCNDAALLTRVAAKHPSSAFVGIDWKCRALHTGAGQVAAAGLRNVALLHGRAQDVRRVFADGELHELWLFHPDPCDKPQELRNRLVTEPFLLDVHRVLRPGGTFVLKTDHPGYYQWVLGLLGLPEPDVFKVAREPNQVEAGCARVRVKDLPRPEDIPAPSTAIIERFDVSATSADFWNDDDDARGRSAGRCFAGEATSFESRFIKKRLPIYYLELSTRQHIR
jgi:tRNA (guanine-N7-)-methyltransferase